MVEVHPLQELEVLQLLELALLTVSARAVVGAGAGGVSVLLAVGGTAA